MTYARTRKDFEALEEIAPLDDWINMADELENFMRNPTKKFAAMLYEWAIEQWFREHGVLPGSEKIAERHHRL